MKWIYALGVAIASSSWAQAETFRLLCRSYPPDAVVSHVFDVDYERQMVNGRKVTITDTAITWTTTQYEQFMNRNVTYDHKIDRMTAVYTSWGRGIAYASRGPTITCAKAPPPKF